MTRRPVGSAALMRGKLEREEMVAVFGAVLLAVGVPLSLRRYRIRTSA